MSLVPVTLYVQQDAAAPGPESQPAPRPAGESRRVLPADFPHAAHRAALERAVPLDPHREARNFPDLWRRYIRAHYGSLQEVCQVFGVCERTARNWWDGTHGVKAGYLAIALRRHPEAAWDALIGAAA